MNRTPEQIKALLLVRERVHYHRGDPEPRFTPMGFARFESDVADVLAYIRQLERAFRKVLWQRDNIFRWIEEMRCETCSGDCEKCENGDAWEWSGQNDFDSRAKAAEEAGWIDDREAEQAERLVEVNKTLEQITRERDAAISDLQDVIEVADGVTYCEYCKHNEEDGQCHHPCDAYGGESGWEWRGVENE